MTDDKSVPCNDEANRKSYIMCQVWLLIISGFDNCIALPLFVIESFYSTFLFDSRVRMGILLEKGILS